MACDDKIRPTYNQDENRYYLDYDRPDSVGRVHTYYGNFGIILRTLAFIYRNGGPGITEMCKSAVLNANYLKERLKDKFELAYDRICMHESVFSASKQVENGVHAFDIAKYLIDQGFHPPTVYFPLTVKEAIMIEPTETESKKAMDDFVEVMFAADELSRTNPEEFKDLPKTTPVTRPDEVKAARELNANYFAK